MDTWERRNVAVTPGYNNPDFGVLSFTPVYNAGTDELVITASHPVFGPVDAINFQGSNGNGSLASPADFTVDSPTQITVPGAYAALLGPPDVTITQLDFYSTGPVLVGTWVGSVVVAAVLPAEPVATSAIAGGAGQITVVGDYWLTATIGPVDRIVLYFTDLSFQNYYDPSGPNSGLNPGGATVGAIAETGVVITDPAQVGKTLDTIALQDFLGNYFPSFDIPDVAIT